MPSENTGAVSRAGAFAAAVFASAVLGQSALAQDIPQVSSDYSSAFSQFEQAWSAQDLAFTEARFVAEPALGYGTYQPLDSSVFEVGTPFTVYAEPVGYGFGANDKGQHTIDLSVDFELRNTTGQVLAAQDGFATLSLASFNKTYEYQSSLSFALQGLQAGEYVLKVRFNDTNSDKSGSFELPFEMVVPAN